MQWLRQKVSDWQDGLERKIRELDAEDLIRPVSIDFTREERKRITEQVRAYVMASFSKEIVPPLLLAGKEKKAVDLDVCFWVDGETRASAILAEGLPLAVALERCADRALHDGRFRPLVESEIADLRIELTFFGGRWSPLSHEEKEKGLILGSAGFAAMLGGRVVAWYIPAVHNVISFRDLEHLVESLIYHKGKLSSVQAKQVRVYTFPTVGWIEQALSGGVYDLEGPVPASFFSKESPRDIFEAGLSWLFRQEMAPGVFLPKRLPRLGNVHSIDWARLGFTAFVFAEIGRLQKREDCLAAAQRIGAFIDKELGPALFLRPVEKAFTALYMGLAAFALGDAEKSKEWLKRSEGWGKIEKLGPIGRLHGATLLAELGGEYLLRAESIFEQTCQEWKRVRNQAQLALYAQLLPLALELFEKTGEMKYRERAWDIGDWYKNVQNNDGSFPTSLEKNMPYVRGGGKIMEVLALLPKRYQESLGRAFEYAGRFQYSENTLYHIPRSQREDFRGGFRHDAFNREAWIDAAGHVALAGARFLSRQTKR